MNHGNIKWGRERKRANDMIMLWHYHPLLSVIELQINAEKWLIRLHTRLWSMYLSDSICSVTILIIPYDSYATKCKLRDAFEILWYFFYFVCCMQQFTIRAVFLQTISDWNDFGAKWQNPFVLVGVVCIFRSNYSINKRILTNLYSIFQASAFNRVFSACDQMPTKREMVYRNWHKYIQIFCVRPFL